LVTISFYCPHLFILFALSVSILKLSHYRNVSFDLKNPDFNYCEKVNGFPLTSMDFDLFTTDCVIYVRILIIIWYWLIDLLILRFSIGIIISLLVLLLLLVLLGLIITIVMVVIILGVFLNILLLRTRQWIDLCYVVVK
jgi:hypothetical protein